MKKYWRCTVCGDIHYGVKPPEVCPTCGQINVYVEVSSDEALIVQSAESKVNKNDLKKIWTEFANGKDFILNPDNSHVDAIIQGVLINEKNTGLKLCPCRLRDGTKERDLELICPCNFKIQDCWNTKDECWCGLFKKKK